jgi:toxin-antitoxin system PIN domain toxin
VIAPDVNVLLYSLREESERHAEYRGWLERALAGSEPVVLFEPAMAAVLRIATHARIYKTPTPRSVVVAFLDAALLGPAALRGRAGDGHWQVFGELCARADCLGNMVQDAYYAALAIEHACTWMTTDRDFSRFPGLTWRHPLDHAAPITNPS